MLEFSFEVETDPFQFAFVDNRQLSESAESRPIVGDA